ncbi:cation diffusion facilitator family transporter [Solilutibacter silvestris]|uniref:cation diffusion facilitator family transporter n=1 Tax=Solilutibacter silvestris TaxID=1645665 RepID=UPI003D34197E
MSGHHDHSHSNTRAFAWVTLINLAYTAVEAWYGFSTNSLALLSDAVHNFGDVLGLGLAWGAALLAKRPPQGRHTYGWRRATLLSPLANSLLLVVFSGALGWEAIRRFNAPPTIPPVPVMVVAAIGIVVNLAAAAFVHGGHENDLNRRGAFLHLVADAAVSLAAVLAGAGMMLFGWSWLDPVTALLVSVVVLVGSFKLLRDSFDAAMDAAPAHIDIEEVSTFIREQPGVVAVHHLHLWSLGSNEIALTAHVTRPPAPDDSDHDGFIDHLNHALDDRFGINHATLQVEHGRECGHGCHDRAAHHDHHDH